MQYCYRHMIGSQPATAPAPDTTGETIEGEGTLAAPVPAAASDTWPPTLAAAAPTPVASAAAQASLQEFV
jgi:hypothetical protein